MESSFCLLIPADPALGPRSPSKPLVGSGLRPPPEVVVRPGWVATVAGARLGIRSPRAAVIPSMQGPAPEGSRTRSLAESTPIALAANKRGRCPLGVRAVHACLATSSFRRASVVGRRRGSRATGACSSCARRRVLATLRASAAVRRSVMPARPVERVALQETRSAARETSAPCQGATARWFRCLAPRTDVPSASAASAPTIGRLPIVTVWDPVGCAGRLRQHRSVSSAVGQRRRNTTLIAIQMS